MVFLYELVLPPVVEDLFYILPVAGQRSLLFYSNARWQTFGMLERTAEVAYLRLELVDGGGFGAGWGEVVGLSTFGGVVELASRGWLWDRVIVVVGTLGSHFCNSWRMLKIQIGLRFAV